MRQHPCNPRGFTLIELLVAMFITAIVFAMGYGALNQALGNRKQIEQQAARLLEVQKALRVMEQDFELLQPRPVRKSLGDGYDSALIAVVTQSIPTVGSAAGSTLGTSTSGFKLGRPATSAPAASTPAASAPVSNDPDAATLGSEASPLIVLTRGNWTNPAGLQRSELQRVSYFVSAGELIREHLPVLDATPIDVPVRRELMSGVKALSFRFMDGSRAWQQSWPPAVLGITGGTDSATLRSRPVAVEITVQLKDYDTLVRVVEVGD